MRKSIPQMTLISALSLAVAGCQTVPGVTSPCDLLVVIETKTETNDYVVQNDRVAAEGLARNRLRVNYYGCK